MAFILNKNLVFIDSMQFRNSILEKLVTNLSNNNSKQVLKVLVKKNYLIKNAFTFLEKIKQLVKNG